MRISKVQIHNFNSFNKSAPVELHEALSLIIGKNESGKTSFLQALASFDEDYKYVPAELCTYSEDRKAIGDGPPSSDDIRILTVTFALSQEDVASFGKIHESLGAVREFEVTKYFDGNRVLSGAEYQEARRVLNAEISQVNEAVNQRVQSYVEALKASNLFDDALKPVATLGTSDLSKSKPELIESMITAAQTAIRSLNVAQEYEEANKQIDSQLETLKSKLFDLVARRNARPKAIFELLPRFIYFSSVDLLEDRVTIQELTTSPEKYGTLRNLLHLVGLDIDALSKADLYERRRMTRNASAVVTGCMNESWKQENVRVNITLDGDNLVVSVEDDTGAIDPPSRRSQGFQYFLAFYINFSVGSQGELKNTVLLLDDPGVYLHANGQKDLLATMEKLSKTNQIILATHSPFLVDPHRLERLLLADKKHGGVGSSLSKDFHKSTFDALQAVRASVGMTLGNSLFFSKTNYLVEGPSDRWILMAFAEACIRQGLTDFDLGNSAFVGVGGAEKMPYFVHLLSTEGLPFICLLDHDPEGRRARKELIEEVGVDPRLVLTLAETIGDTVDSETEELVDEGLYLTAVNQVYSTAASAEKEFPAIEIAAVNAYEGLRTKKYLRYFRERGLGGFDKEAVARQISAMVRDEQFTFTESPLARERLPRLFATLKRALIETAHHA